MEGTLRGRQPFKPQCPGLAQTGCLIYPSTVERTRRCFSQIPQVERKRRPVGQASRSDPQGSGLTGFGCLQSVGQVSRSDPQGSDLTGFGCLQSVGQVSRSDPQGLDLTG